MKILLEKHLYNSDEKLKLFGYGEWVEEPDYINYIYKNYEGVIQRNSTGALCGYVFIPKNHPWIDVDYNYIDADVHGGLTFREKVEKNVNNRAVNLYCIGFDCAHYVDLVPGINKNNELLNNIWKFEKKL